MSEPLLLSICVPTFNRAWLLERNVTFHLQAFRERGIAFEIVIVDDCSTDETAAYLDKWAGISELSIFRRHKNSGFLDNYAFAMRRAQGRYAIFLGDDDLLIPDQVIAYLNRLESDPAIGMIQSPWMEIDARAGGGEMGPFYKIPQEIRFRKGDYGGLGDFILQFHVFPEFMIVRRDVLVRSISSNCPFIFWAFLFTARAQAHADIVFSPAPFAQVTALSDDPRMRHGNSETMFQWDRYRGGIEYIVALALRGSKAPLEARKATTEAINRFMSIREKVALKLLINAGHWVEAYILLHRITAYEPMPVSAEQLTAIARMAGFISAARDAVNFSAEAPVVDPKIDDGLFRVLPEDIRKRLAVPDSHAASGPRAYLRLDPGFPAHMNPGDIVFDTAEYIAQFV